MKWFKRHPIASCILAVVLFIALAMPLFILYKERTRTIEGIWVDLFEGSRFFESQTLEQGCNDDFDGSPHFDYFPLPGTPRRDLVDKHRESGWLSSEHGDWPIGAYSVKFVGREKISELLGFGYFLGVGYGHMGGHGSSFEIDQIISMEPIPNPYCDIR